MGGAGVRRAPPPSSVARNRQPQGTNNALHDYIEQRKSLHTLQGAMKRAGWLPARRTGRMPGFLVAHHSRRDEGPLRPSQPSRHSFVVAVDRESEETWIVDPLLLQPAEDLAVSFPCEGFIVEGIDTEGGAEAELRVLGGQSRHLLHV